MNDDFFWLCALAQIFVALRFTILVSRIEKPLVSPLIIKLADGQRQDSWLSCALIWGVILVRGTSFDDLLYLGAVCALVWLIIRACQRTNRLTTQSTR